MLRFRLALLILVIFQIANVSRAQQEIQFATIDERPLFLDLYLPEVPNNAGLIVWIHGGVWRAGSRKSVALKGLIEKGWAIASVDYRLSGEAKFPAQIHDIKAAIRYLRANPEKLNYEADKIIIAGSSAGAHLAALVGVSNHHPELEGTVGNHLDQDSSIQAIVSLFGASNLTTILKQSTPHGLNVRVPALELFIGGQPDDLPEVAELASPVFHVDSQDPPLLLIHGDQDPQMPINQSHELQGAYEEYRLLSQLEVIHGAAHGGPAFSDGQRLQLIDNFLHSQLQ